MSFNETYTDSSIKPRGLTCACCGEYTKGRQWWNRDTGYGVCPSCYQDEVKRNGSIVAIDCYGKPGVHHSLTED
jgi:hypothetical protein